jgi:hypothetical protein
LVVVVVVVTVGKVCRVVDVVLLATIRKGGLAVVGGVRL